MPLCLPSGIPSSNYATWRGRDPGILKCSPTHCLHLGNSEKLNKVTLLHIHGGHETSVDMIVHTYLVLKIKGFPCGHWNSVGESIHCLDFRSVGDLDINTNIFVLIIIKTCMMNPLPILASETGETLPEYTHTQFSLTKFGRLVQKETYSIFRFWY
jgi:hypothetical protein